jgi:small subunit ribosomal protein S18
MKGSTYKQKRHLLAILNYRIQGTFKEQTRKRQRSWFLKKQVRSKYRPEYPGDFVFDYKDPQTLGRFVMEGGKIIPSRISKLSMAQQKKVASAIKKARAMALLPIGSDAYDTFGRPEMISPKPFEI